MKIKCDYCGKLFDNTLENCPNCGGPNDHVARSSNEEPETIEELKQWYKDHNLPPEGITRFFIGKNKKEAKVFGIYKDEETGDFIVYKNKDNGQRAVRYKGKDEKYAVHEFYQKLRSEISNQKENNRNKRRTPQENYRSQRNQMAPSSDSNTNFLWIMMIPFLMMLLMIVGVFAFSGKNDTSRNYNDNETETETYNDNETEDYDYDEMINDWESAYNQGEEFVQSFMNYLESYSDDSDNNDTNDSYDSSSPDEDDDDWGSDWDNDSFWDSGDSWDSDSSDWDSDW